jgi:FAD/FMN-containing dehydrogenase
MKQGPDLVTPGSDPQNTGVATRRTVLMTAGLVGAAGVAGHYLGGASANAATTTARPVWLAGPSTNPSEADWNALRHMLSTGKLYRPGQPGYNTAKELFDPRFDSLEPAGVAYCARPADVAACISFVKKFKLPMRVRSRGHNYEGWSSVNKGLIIDVSDMSSFKVGNGTVTVGSGIDLIDFYAGLAAHGKAVPGGSCPTVGIAGLALGGGIGVLARNYGLTSDNIQSVDIVTADGSTLTCTPSNSHSDLLWASKGGGGGNFGVVTSFTLKTYDLRSLYLFSLVWNWQYAARAISAWQSWAPHGPDALWSNMHLSAATGGSPHIGVGGTWVGSRTGAIRVINQFLAKVGPHPLSFTITPNTFLEAMVAEAGCSNFATCHLPPRGTVQRVPWYAKSDFFSKPLNSAGISAALRGIEGLARVHGAAGGNGSISFDALGGKVNRVKPADTAFVHRDALWVSQYYTSWNWPGSATGRQNQLKWMDSYYNSLHPHANGQAYQNYIDSSLANWRVAYYEQNYTRLSEIKAKYDKNMVFNFPQAITPPAQIRCDQPDC